MAIEIEKGIPIPLYAGQRGTAAKYPWKDMNVGDSFFVEGADTKQMSSAVYGVSKRTGFKFACRSVDGGTRVWRIA